MDDNSIEFQDSASYRNQEASIKNISLKLFQKATEEGSKEWTTGGVIKRLVEGKVVDIVVPNQKEIFVNSVKMCFVPIIPQIPKIKNEKTLNLLKSAQEKIRVNEELYEKQLQELKNNYKDAFRRTSNPEGEMKREVRLKDYESEQEFITNLYETSQVEAHRKLLTSIAYILDEINYFEETGGTM